MAKITLRAKLFIGACALALCVGALLAGVAKWSLERGFGRYLAQDEIAGLAWFAEEAGRAYVRSGGWDFLTESQGPWDRAIRSSARGLVIGALPTSVSLFDSNQSSSYEPTAAGPRPPPIGAFRPGGARTGPPQPIDSLGGGAIPHDAFRQDKSAAPPQQSANPDLVAGQASHIHNPVYGPAELSRDNRVEGASRAMERIAEPPQPYGPVGSETLNPPVALSDRARAALQGPGSRLPPSPELSAALPRLRLLDANGGFLAGSRSTSRLAVSLPIAASTGSVVGFLELDPVENFDQRAMAFVATQSQALWLGMGGALALSLLAAWAGSRHLTGPLRSLEAAAARIERGDFSARSGVERGDELGALGRSFDAMAERIDRTDQERQQWISDSSHELRTPLAVLRAEVEALQDGVRKPDEKSLARLHKNIMQMGKLVDDLRLSLDRSGGAAPMVCEACHPASLAKEVGLEFKARFVEAGIVLDILGLDKWATAKANGDPDRLRQVFVNLFENSARYTSRGGRLVAASQAKGGKLILRFDDTSPSPPDSAMPKLFDRFYRADPSRSRELGGSGLGLAICKSLIEAHGGTISASKSELGGLCLKITLPMEA